MCFIQSYLEKDSLISAQYPLPDNTEDFLRLVKDFDARVVVFLCPLKDIESVWEILSLFNIVYLLIYLSIYLLIFISVNLKFRHAVFFLQTSKWYPSSEGQTKFDGMFYIKNLSSTKAANVTINRLNIQPTVYFLKGKLK